MQMTQKFTCIKHLDPIQTSILINVNHKNITIPNKRTRLAANDQTLEIKVFFIQGVVFIVFFYFTVLLSKKLVSG